MRSPMREGIMAERYPGPPKSGRCVDCVHFECCPGDSCGWGVCRLGLAEEPAERWWVLGEDSDVYGFCKERFEAVPRVAA